MSTTITIGRADDNTFQVQEEFAKVSRHHGKIDAKENGQMTYTDFSSCGTTINGKPLHQGTMTVSYGDEIVLGGQCAINWDIIANFLPVQDPGKKTELFDKDNGHKTELFNPNNTNNEQSHTPAPDPTPMPAPIPQPFHRGKTYSPSEIGRETRKWNWGAFLLNVIWSTCHKIYWPLYILAANLIITPLPLFIKDIEEILIIGGIITWIVHLALFVVAVYLGINGSEIAWNKGICDKDLDKFKQKQQHWALAGTITWAAAILVLTTTILVKYS